MVKLRISPEAQSDLHGLKEYITTELENPTAAVKIVAKIMKAIRGLTDFPASGVPLSSIVDIPNDYRFLVCGNYLVFYRYKDGNISIMRVIYDRRDYIKILFGDIQESEFSLIE